MIVTFALQSQSLDFCKKPFKFIYDVAITSLACPELTNTVNNLGDYLFTKKLRLKVNYVSKVSLLPYMSDVMKWHLCDNFSLAFLL